MIGADFILSAILGALKPLWPYLIAALAALGALWKAHSMGAASERTKQKAKEADAYEQHLRDLEAASAASNAVRPDDGGVRSDPNNRDRKS